jgi:hypothetical protein
MTGSCARATDGNIRDAVAEIELPRSAVVAESATTARKATSLSKAITVSPPALIRWPCGTRRRVRPWRPWPARTCSGWDGTTSGLGAMLPACLRTYER